MESLWSLEEKLNLTLQESVLLLVLVAAIGGSAAIFTAAAVLRRNSGENKVADPEWATVRPSRDWAKVRMVLTGSLKWSRAARWRRLEQVGGERRLVVEVAAVEGRSQRWRSHGSASPVWQRPILMGEKCEFPRFSGLILYDERGRPLECTHQEKTAAPTRTTLRDLL